MADGETEQEPQVESLPTNAATPQGESAPAQPVETGEQATPKAGDDTSPPPVKDGTSTDGTPRDERGRFAPKAAEVDPVQQAIDKLAKPQQPAKAAKATEPAKPSAPAKDAPATKPAPASLPTDPLADLKPSDDEAAKFAPRTKERFDKLFERTRSLHDELEKVRPIAEDGKAFNDLLDQYQVRDDIGFVAPDHLAGLIRGQASVNRAILAEKQGRAPAKADLEHIANLGASLDKIRGQFGITAATTPPAVTPFTGELTAEYKDLIEVYGIDEKRVRLLAALESGGASAPAAPAKPPAATPPAQPAQPRPEGVDMEQIYTRQLLNEWAGGGDPQPSQTMRVLLSHPATKMEVARRFQLTNMADVPAVFNALDPKERMDVLRAARRAITPPATEQPKQVPARSTQPPPPTQRTLTRSASLRAAPEANGDPVAAAIALLAQE